MKVLGIETSCDETAVTLLECAGGTDGATYTVLGSGLFSQAALHAEYGGVYPNLAKREHRKNLPVLLEKVLHDAGMIYHTDSPTPDIDLIAVTSGPGLEPALWEGITFAEALGTKWGVPVLGIDHMEGHIVSALLKQVESKKSKMERKQDVFKLSTFHFPLLALLISGGHTELILMRAWHQYELVGATRDDAVGEAFDKVARMLGLPYPGGPEIAKAAKGSREVGGTDITFPRPMIGDQTCDFSFSGLKTAVLYKLRDMGEMTDADKAKVAQAFEDAARDVLVLKTKRALEKTGAATLVVGGGVSANTHIREGIEELVAKEFPNVQLAFPDRSLTGDNAVMIAAAGYLRSVSGTAPSGEPLKAVGHQVLA